jgi:hypothetical protein
MSLLPLEVGWGILLVVLIVLAFRRGAIARAGDDMLHVGDAAAAAISAHQVEVTKKLEAIERLMKILGLILAVYGLALVGLFIYKAWVASASVAG